MEQKSLLTTIKKIKKYDILFFVILVEEKLERFVGVK